MAITFADQALAFLTDPANQGSLPDTLGMPAFASVSFKRRYAKEGFQLNGMTFGVPTDFRFQEMLVGETRMSGFREKRSEHPERNWYELRVGRAEPAWIDASFTVPVQFSVEAISLPLGAGGDFVRAGASEPGPSQHLLKFQMPVTTGPFTLAYGMKAFIFAASDPSPVGDLRRICCLRRALEDDPGFLVTLDGSPSQTPLVFIQLYKKGVFGADLSEANAVRTFAAADVLAFFLAIPAM